MIKKALCYVGFVLIALCLIAVVPKSRTENAYDRGYASGYAEAEDRMLGYAEDEYNNGYEDGYNAGIWESETAWLEYNPEAANHFCREAEHYASRASEWHPEEAWVIIEAYRTGSYVDFCGSVPSWQDYQDAVDSLICFYDYFYGSMYE